MCDVQPGSFAYCCSSTSCSILRESWAFPRPALMWLPPGYVACARVGAPRSVNVTWLSSHVKQAFLWVPALDDNADVHLRAVGQAAWVIRLPEPRRCAAHRGGCQTDFFFSSILTQKSIIDMLYKPSFTSSSSHIDVNCPFSLRRDRSRLTPSLKWSRNPLNLWRNQGPRHETQYCLFKDCVSRTAVGCVPPSLIFGGWGAKMLLFWASESQAALIRAKLPWTNLKLPPLSFFLFSFVFVLLSNC